MQKEFLKEGDKAPGFAAKDHAGKEISLKDFSGKKLILYFYPKDDTPGCTAEACNLRDNFSVLREKGFEVVGISPDAERSHNKFIDKYNLPFRLIPDPDKKIINAYHVWGKKKFMGKEYEGVLRTTFVIGETGIIEQVITDVKTKDHANQILEAYHLA